MYKIISYESYEKVEEVVNDLQKNYHVKPIGGIATVRDGHVILYSQAVFYSEHELTGTLGE